MKNLTKALPDNLLCFSHLRWDFVFQRPQHLLSRLSKSTKIYFIEEPLFDAKEPYFTVDKKLPQLSVCTPHLSSGLSKTQIDVLMSNFLDSFLSEKDLEDFAFWYYSPMALSYTDKFMPKLTIYDCMDELSAFKFAPEELKELEQRLLGKADIVFTGGNTLFEAKKHMHTNIFPFPSSIEKEHFMQARTHTEEPADQMSIEGPKIGFYGVIDERFDIELIRIMASERPDWNFIMIGPVVKIDPETLPKYPNIYYTGQRSYDQLPSYLSGWDIALIPFMINESTRFISPTKTPEYLAAGIPVVSTPISDVVNPYGFNELVHIGSDANDFITAIETELNSDSRDEWLQKVDEFLEGNSWDLTCECMRHLMAKTLSAKGNISLAS